MMTLSVTLLAGLLLTQAPAPPPTPAPSVPTVQEHLQLRAEAEDLRLERARLNRQIAELRGLVEYLGAAEVQDLSTRRKDLDAAIAAAGLQRDAQGRVTPPPAAAREPPGKDTPR